MRGGQTHEYPSQGKVDDDTVGKKIFNTHKKSLDNRIVLLKL
jgi:hypothetical protein